MPVSRQPRAVLFDFDGVLADTENVHVAAWERTFARLGWDIPPETCARAAEQDDETFLRELFSARRIDDADITGWLARKQTLTLSLLSHAPRLYAGISELVETLSSRGVVLAVVTGTWRENANQVLKTTGLAGAFRCVVGKEDVARLKPAPDAYLRALATLGIGAGDAIALEDSPTGLQSARDAQLRAVAVGHRRSPGPWTGDAFYLDNFRDLEATLHILGFRRRD